MCVCVCVCVCVFESVSWYLYYFEHMLFIFVFYTCILFSKSITKLFFVYAFYLEEKLFSYFK